MATLEAPYSDSRRKPFPTYIETFASRIANEDDRALFLLMYKAKKPSDFGTALALAIILSPPFAYAYMKCWLFVVAYILLMVTVIATIGFYWILALHLIAWLSMYSTVQGHNTELAEDAYNELLLNRKLKAA
jgi:hypothetical protein